MGENIWEKIVIEDSSDDIWNDLTKSIKKAFPKTPNNIWQQLNNRPGGIWQNVENETILLTPSSNNHLWKEINDETIIINPSQDIWNIRNNNHTNTIPDVNIWHNLNDETLIINTHEQNYFRTNLTNINKTDIKPQKKLGWALKQLISSKNEPYYVLKNLRQDQYLRLNDKQVFLWNLMDGEHSIQDIAVAYFVKYKSLPIQYLLDLLRQLEIHGFIDNNNLDIYSEINNGINQHNIGAKLNNQFMKLRKATLSIKNIDDLVSKLYKYGLFLLFKWPIKFLIFIITILGLIMFYFVTTENRHSLVLNVDGNITLGLIGLYVAFAISILIHELSHAITCKHFGREVHEAGIMLYLGLPAFFVDTTDIWMENRKARILVSIAGPFSGLFLAALSSLIIFFIPDLGINGILYQFAFSSLILTLTNLNPLIMLDGYFILMDWMEMPMLRARAISFICNDLKQKIFSKSKFNRDEKIYTIFGSLSLIYTSIVILSLIKLYGGRIKIFTLSIMGPITGIITFFVLWGLLFVTILWPYFYKIIDKKNK